MKRSSNEEQVRLRGPFELTLSADALPKPSCVLSLLGIFLEMIDVNVAAVQKLQISLSADRPSEATLQATPNSVIQRRRECLVGLASSISRWILQALAVFGHFLRQRFCCLKALEGSRIFADRSPSHCRLKKTAFRLGRPIDVPRQAKSRGE